MISFNYDTDFKIEGENGLVQWLNAVIIEENASMGEISYIFCSDEYLHKLNVDYLGHDTYTDIITFDYSVGKELHGDVFISVDRVRENATQFGCEFNNELARVMVHGILHLCGYKDKSAVEATIMRGKEDYYLGQLA